MSVVGYFINCDDALCEGCFEAAYGDKYAANDTWPLAVANWKAAGGFESWEEPIVTFSDTEYDTPTHCKECGELIPHALTSEGYLYVEEAAREHIADVGRGKNPNAHSVRVVKAWTDEYDHNLDGIVQGLHDALYALFDEAGYFDDEEL